MSTKELTAEKVPTTMGVKVEAGTESILAIAVSRHEDLLEEQRLRLEEQLKRLQKQKEELIRELDAAAKAQVTTQYEPGLKDLAEQLRTFGFEKVAETLEDIVLDITEEEITVMCKLSADDRSQRYYTNRETLVTRKKVPASEAIKARIADLRKICEEHDNHANLHTEVRRALANIDRVERRARAALAKKVLQATEDGRALLETMEGVDSPFRAVLQLGAPKG